MPDPEDSSKKKKYRHSSSASSDIDSDASSEFSLPTPPDGGWGWLVVFASFMVNMIADGCAFSFGVLYVELLDYFKESKGKTAWVGSVAVSIPLITGPIASAFTNKYGCRITTMLGSLIATVGFLLGAFSPSIEVLCLTFGLIAGFGLSMVYVPAVVVVAFYFEKRRAFATGIAVAGSGIGTFLFAPLTELLIEKYSWRGALIILAGLMLNIMVCGAVFRPLDTPMHKKKAKKRNASRTPSTSSSRQIVLGDDYSGHSAAIQHALSLNITALLQDPVTHSLITIPTFMQRELATLSPDILRDIKARDLDHISNSDDLHKYIQSRSMTSIAGTRTVSQQNGLNGHANTVLATSKSTIDHKNTSVTKLGYKYGEDDDRKELDVWCRQASRPRISRTKLQDQYLPMYRKDIFYRGSLLNASRLHQDMGKSASCADILLQFNDSSSEDLHSDCSIFSLLQLSKEVKHVIKEMLDLALLKNIVFVYLILSSMLLYMWYDVPYIYTPDKAQKMGISEEKSSFLVSIIGITSTVGQIVVGFIGDQPRVNSLLLYNILTSIAGGVTMLVPVLINYGLLAAYCAAYGFFISGNYALTTIILVDLLGMEKLTNAYGLVMLGEGIANLVGPPLAGWIADVTGSYDMAFYISGAGIFMSGSMLFAIPWIRKCSSNHSLTLENQICDHAQVDKYGEESFMEPDTQRHLLTNGHVKENKSLLKVEQLESVV